MFRLKCDICGEKSDPVADHDNMTLAERISIAHFKGQHDLCRARSFIPVPISPQCGPFGSEKPAPKAVRKPAGHFYMTGPYGEQCEGDTARCVHCGRHWEVRLGSGIERGFCQNCMGYVCGPKCFECRPLEQRIENAMVGLDPLTPAKPTILVPESFDGIV